MTSSSWPPAVAALLRAHRLETVPTDLPAARGRLQRALEKVSAAERIVEIDVDIAYVSAYDAMRVAVTAHMLANGIRVPGNRPGAHEAVGVHAEAMLVTPSTSEFQRMRRRRNKAEYDDIVVGLADVEADLTHVRAVLDAVGRYLDP